MSEIRSVSVHLDADVAGYIAKMKLAGAATDQAFSGTDRRLAGVNTQLSGVQTSAGKAERALGSLDRTVGRSGNSWTTYTKKVDGFVSRLIALPGLALGAVAALQPLAVAAAGVAAAFAPPVAFAGGGLGLFAILGGFAVKETNDALKNIDTAQKKLSTLTKGTKEYAQAQKDLRDAQKALTPQQREYSRSLDDLHESFDRTMGGKSGVALLAPISAALELGAHLLPRVQPIIKATSDGLVTLITDLDKFSQTNKFSRFVHDVADQIGPDLVIGGRALGHFTEGIGNLLVTAGKTPAARGLLRELGHLGDSFASWSSSKQGRQEVQGFFRYFHQIGPDVASTIGHVADAVTQVSRALAPIGPVELRVIGGIASAIASIPIPVLTALASAAIGLGALQKVGGIKALGAYGNLISGHGGVPGTGGGPGGAFSRLGVQDVFVVNMPPGLGGPGGPGGVPIVTAPRGGVPGAGLGGTVGVTAEEAAKTAAALAKAAGATVAEQGAAAEKAFLSAQAAAKAAGETAAAAAFTFGKIAGPLGLLKTVLGAPILVNESGTHRNQNGTSTPNYGTPFTIPKGGVLPKELTAGLKIAATGYDNLKQHAANASRQMDLVGPRGANAAHKAAAATKDLSEKLNRVDGAKAERSIDLVGHSAERAGAVGGAAMDNLHHKVDAIPGNKSINVTANTGQSLSQLRAVASELNAIRSKTITLTTRRVTGGSSRDGLATGGYVAGAGTSTSDSIPAWLSNGEYVMKAAAVSYYGLGTMHAMNAGRYASGGSVGTGAGSGNATDGVRGELHRLAHSLHEATTELDKERQSLQNMRQVRAQLISTVESNFRSDPFATPGGIWAAASDPRSVLRGDIKGARHYRRDIHQLRRRGLSGGVLDEIDTLAEAEQVKGMSPRALKQLEHLYDRRQKVTRAAGVALGDAREGRAIARQEKLVHAQAQDVHLLTQQQKEANRRLAAIEKHTRENAHKTGQELNGASGKATRRVRKT